MGKFDDTGIISPNKYRKGNDKAPTHKGVINLSRDTLKKLLQAFNDDGEAKLELSGWRKTDKPDMISLKIQLPYEGGGEKRGGSRRRDDDEDDRRSTRRDRDRYDDRDDDRGSRGRDRDRDYDDEIPSKRQSRGRDKYDDDDYRDERDL